MSDPIRELEDLKHEGIAVNPMSAAEVRRRGTRLRRRNNALAAAGALAVALVVATPIAVIAGGSDHADNLPVAPSPSPDKTVHAAWKQQIPGSSDDFDLTALPDDATFRYTVRPLPVVDDLTVCGGPTFSTRSDDPVAPAVDSLGAAYGEGGTDGDSGRTLALYENDQVAAKVLDAVRHGVETCPTEQQGRGAPLVYAAVDTELPVDESFVFTQQAQMDKDLLSDLTVFQVARVGNAVYLASSHTSAGGPQVADAEVRRMAEWSAPVLSDMCIFAADPCDVPGDSTSSSAGPSPAIGEGAVSAIPADFPIAANITQPEGPLDGPSATAEGVTMPELCGAPAWPAANTVERLAVTSKVPQLTESRELVTFARTDDATAALTRVRDSVGSCPVIPGDTPADDKLVELQPVDGADLGGADEAVTFSITYREGLGGSIYQFVRVGRAVYGTYVDGEFARDSISQAIAGVGGKTREMVPQLCPWTERGC